MDNVFKKIENEIARRLVELNAMRDQLKQADSNNVHEQSRLLIDIAIKARELDAVERMYRIVRGDK